MYDHCALSQAVKDEMYKCYPEAKRAHLKDGGNFPYLSRAEEVNVYIQVSVHCCTHILHGEQQGCSILAYMYNFHLIVKDYQGLHAIKNCTPFGIIAIMVWILLSLSAFRFT